MPNNGAAVRLPCTPVELAVTFDESLGGAEGWIAAILVAVMDISAIAVQEIRAGQLTNKTRLQGGDLVARLTVIREKIGERDFADTVRRVGRRATRAYAPLSEAEIDEIIGTVAEVARELREMN